MIIQKTITLQEIPDFKNIITEMKKRNCLFLDIETTGLSPSRDTVYLIGALVQKQNDAILHQWFAPSQTEEKELLAAFLDFASPYESLVHFNGCRFDLPFLKARCQAQQLSFRPLQKSSLDLFTKLKPCQTLLKLPNGRLSAWTKFLGLSRKDDLSGKECIRRYQKYCATGEETLLTSLLLHNQEDLAHLPMLLLAQAYLQIPDGAYTLLETAKDATGFIAKLSLALPLPQVFSYGSKDAYITGEKQTLRLQLFSKNGKLKKYYADYKNYYYLPGEDTAIHKHLGRYVDASLRTKATPKTCYTWFPIEGEFQQNPLAIENYLKENLRLLLDI